MKNKTIVKVQISLSSTDKKKYVLVYNETNSVHYEAEASEEMIKFMNGRDKVYLYAWHEGTELVLDKEAPNQQW